MNTISLKLGPSTIKKKRHSWVWLSLSDVKFIWYHVSCICCHCLICVVNWGQIIKSKNLLRSEKPPSNFVLVFLTFDNRNHYKKTLLSVLVCNISTIIGVKYTGLTSHLKPLWYFPSASHPVSISPGPRLKLETLINFSQCPFFLIKMIKAWFTKVHPVFVNIFSLLKQFSYGGASFPLRTFESDLFRRNCTSSCI